MAEGEYTGIVLAGGRSSRMGRDKGWINWKGRALVHYALETLQDLCSTLLISANDPAYEKLGYEVIPDIHPDSGPIAGIHAALLRSVTPVNLVIPVDTPLVSADVYRQLLRFEDGQDLVVSVDHLGYYQPLCALYNKSVIPVIEKQIREGIFGFTPLFRKTECREVRFDNSLPFYNESTFLNANTPADLE